MHAFREVVEVVDDRQVLRQLVDGRPGEAADPVDDPQHQEHREGHHERDDLVLRQARDEQADRDEAAAEQQQPEIGRHDRLPLRTAVDEQQADVNQRDGEHHAVQRHRAEELAHDDLEVGERRGEQQLDRARSLLLRVGPHRHHRQHEQDQDRHVLREQRPDHLLVDVHRLRPGLPNWLICMLWRTKKFRMATKK